ncbi:hypothetical protein Tco_0403982 [Tanacetum coccineum]
MTLEMDNAFNGMNGGDVTNHVAKVLEITEWIKMPNVEKNELRLHVFSKSLSGDAETCFYYSIIKDKDEGMSHARTLIDIPVFVGRFSIISGFTIIDDDDMTKDVVLGMKFCKKYASCQMIMKKFALGDKCEQIMKDE